MRYALETSLLGKRYGRHWALRNCTLEIPHKCIAGLVGLNGAGKTTLLHLAVGLLKPTEGTVRILGTSSLNTATFLPRIGFVAQERSLYRHFTLGELLIAGKKLNPSWDSQLAYELVERLKLPRKQSLGKLSGGQQAQIALIMALAKRPELLLLDEPFVSVDPLAKHELNKILMEIYTQQSLTILISSHVISDLEPICDHLILLAASQVKLAQGIEQIMDQHTLLIGPHDRFEALSKSHRVLQASHRGRQSTVLLRTDRPVIDPFWQAQDLSLETIVLAYLASSGIVEPSLQIPPLLKEVLQ